MAIKVKEFKFEPSEKQKQQFADYAYGLKKFWNYCLEQFEILDEYSYYNKHDKKRAPCCPLPWIIRGKTGESLPLEKRQPYSQIYGAEAKAITKGLPEVKVYTPKKGENPQDTWKRIKNPERAIVSSASVNFNYGWVGGWGYSCPIGIHRSAQIETFPASDTHKSFGILNKTANIEQADIPNDLKAAILKVPYKYRAGTLKQLCTSWNEYVKSRSKQNELERGKPKYKRYRDRVDTIIHPNPNAGKSKPATKDACRIKPNDILVLPSFGEVKVKGLNQRWLSHETVPRVKTVKIINRPSGWYIQLTGEFEPRDRRYRQAHGAIGIDSGWSEENWITTDRDCTTKPRWYREGEEKLAELQRQLDQKRLHRVILWLNHPENSIERIKSFFPKIAKDDLIKMMSCKSSTDLNLLVSQGEITRYALQKLKHYDFYHYQGETCQLIDKHLSIPKREWQLKNQIASHHEQLKRRRRAHNHKRSTWLSRKYEVIRVEDGLQQTAGRAQAKISEDSHQFERNNQSARSGMNKSLLDAAHGQFMQLLEDKSKINGLDFERLKPNSDKHPVTGERIAPSQMCPVCGHKNPAQKDLNNKDFKCDNCGFIHASRDRIPGINFSLWAYFEGKATIEQLGKEAASILVCQSAFNGGLGNPT